MTSPSPATWVLLVDDNTEHLEQLAELLPDFDISVAGITDRGEHAVGAIAAAFAEGRPVNVVLMDVRMPGIGGLEATRQVKAAYPHIQVLLYTAFAGHLDQQARQAGACAEVPKGASLTDLVTAIRQASQHPPIQTPTAP